MGYLNTIYKKKNYKIYDVGEEYIVHNSRLDFNTHHTHINNFNTCKYIIDLCIHKTVPKHLSDYLLVSIIRISDDREYIGKIQSMLDNNNSKKHYHAKQQRQEYRNHGKKRKQNKNCTKAFPKNLCS